MSDYSTFQKVQNGNQLLNDSLTIGQCNSILWVVNIVLMVWIGLMQPINKLIDWGHSSYSCIVFFLIKKLLFCFCQLVAHTTGLIFQEIIANLRLIVFFILSYNVLIIGWKPISWKTSWRCILDVEYTVVGLFLRNYLVNH